MSKPTHILQNFLHLIPALFFLVLSSRLQGLDSFERLQNLKFHRISVRTGLAHNWINNIIKDSDGFIWFATDNGLVRYDGTEVKNYFYDQKDTTSLFGHYVISFLIDRNNKFWVSTDLGLMVYNKTCDNFQRIKVEVADENIFNIGGLELLSDNTLLALTTNRILRYDNKSGSLKPYLSLNEMTDLDKTDAFTQCFYDPASGLLWIATTKKFILVEYPSRKYSCFDHSCGTIRSLAHIEKSNLYISTLQGLFILDLNTRKIERFVPEAKEYQGFFRKEIREVLPDNEGNYWIASVKDGIVCYNKETARYIHYYSKKYDDQSLSDNLIHKLYIDNHGILWVGTQYNGVSFAILRNPKEFVIYPNSADQVNILSSRVITAVIRDAKNNIWMGTDGDGLNIIENQTGKISTLYSDEKRPGELTTNSILSLYQDHKGNIWAGGYMGAVSCYNPLTRTWIHYKNICKQPGCEGLHDVRKFLEDSKQRLWIATNGHGLFMFDHRSKNFSYYSSTDGRIISNHILSLCEAEDGRIWIGTYNGACLMDPESAQTIFYSYSAVSQKGLSNNWIHCIHRDSRNRIWLGTAYGLNRFDPDNQNFKHYFISDGLPGNVIDGILEDENGYLWISTNNGISKFNADSSAFLNYYADDGLPGNEYIRGSYHRTDDGEMFFGSNEGLVSFYPSRIKPDTIISPIVIRDVFVFFKSIAGENLCNTNFNASGEKKIKLSYKQSTVTFSYTALNYRNTRNNKFSYILEGYEQKWNHVGDRREATYTNLRPGNYLFRVTGCNNDGIWDRVGDRIMLEILPPWWGTWYFKVCLGIGLFLSIMGLYHWRLYSIVRQKTRLESLVHERTVELEEKNSKLYELNKMNDRVFSIIAHDLKSPFSTIVAFIEVLAEKKIIHDEASSSKYISLIQTALKKISVLMENLLLWSSSQLKGSVFNPTVYSLPVQVRNNIELIHDAALHKSVSVRFDNAEEYRVKADFNMIDAVIRNLLSNAVKFSNPAGEITVSLASENNEVICSVSDQGVGMDMEDIDILFSMDSKKLKTGTNGEQGSGLGLVISHDFIVRNGGRIWVKSTIGKGSTFSFAIPQAE